MFDDVTIFKKTIWFKNGMVMAWNEWKMKIRRCEFSFLVRKTLFKYQIQFPQLICGNYKFEIVS